MKKIVALVLSLVMVLGLATVAFGASTTNYNDKDVTLTDAQGAVIAVEDCAVVKYEKSTSTSTVDGKTVTTIVPAYYEIAKVSPSYKYVEVDKSLADYLMKIEDVGSVYVAEMTAVPSVNAADVATVYVAPLKAACGVVGAGFAQYYVVDGKYYAADVAGAKTALVDGNYVRMATTATLPTDHNWAKAKACAWDEATGLITAVECPDCEEEIAVYKVAGTFDGKTYVAVTAGDAKGYFYVAGAAANTVVPSAPAVDGDKVESAETFDAGIAMYVGMSVMAAAGSAVVLKKKD